MFPVDFYIDAYDSIVNACSDISFESSPDDYLDCLATTIEECGKDLECDYEVLYFIAGLLIA
jgi:hypothetical protein